MGKVLIITGLLYLLYYTGNVVYDLFIKKQIVSKNEQDGELISLENIIEEIPPSLTTINEDEVENLNLPSSYDYDETELSNYDDESFTRHQYEEEQEIDNFYVKEQQEEDGQEVRQSFLSSLSSVIGSKNSEASPEKEIIPTVISDEMFRNFFEKASKHIVVASESGHSFYKSSLVF
ncbi:hypothetical protein BBI01_18050 [Chryseobacterium artocarpi]|uniref:Uncharacterized protein n=1 Tax=Chryseobacterium artocarpi TaxID=1414727 RepID=A0A1B8ZBW0_9FLAO|nr:hypothetical protein [Chryseobacterium artocarpi]OCA69112.1 hypothetical protein BBI01_18050 [Chryseobacterium artocarpi]